MLDGNRIICPLFLYFVQIFASLLLKSRLGL